VGMFVLFTDLLQKDFLMGPYQKAFPAAGAGMPRIETPLFNLTPNQVLIVVVTLALLAVVYLILTRTRGGDQPQPGGGAEFLPRFGPGRGCRGAGERV